MVVYPQETVARSRSRTSRPTAAFYRDEDELHGDTQPARQRRRGGRKGRGKKKKQGRSFCRQPYMNTCLSTPYLHSKFMR